ncbi:MAG TPA: hypothetical protein VJU60_03765 [Thermoleophilaceae bacterium]|nr:hypothetical protein [Thermoleophilaceae bacterium]
MWWKFGLSLVAIVGAGVVVFFEVIASSADSENCGGCDPMPGWVDPLSYVAGIAALLWLAALLFVIARAIRRRLAARS